MIAYLRELLERRVTFTVTVYAQNRHVRDEFYRDRGLVAVDEVGLIFEPHPNNKDLDAVAMPWSYVAKIDVNISEDPRS